jgi:hypothetical protein
MNNQALKLLEGIKLDNHDDENNKINIKIQIPPKKKYKHSDSQHQRSTSVQHMRKKDSCNQTSDETLSVQNNFEISNICQMSVEQLQQAFP